MDPRKSLFTIALGLLILAPSIRGFTRPIKIGAIIHKDDEDQKSTFLKAISDIKYENPASAFEFIPVIKYIDVNTDSFRTAAAACELLKEGVAAIFGPTSRHTSWTVANIAARFNVPHIEYVWQENQRINEESKKKAALSSMTINVFPASEKLSQAIADLIDSMKWRNFAVIYENDEGLSRIQKILTLKGDKNNLLTHMVQRLNEGPDYRSVLKEIRFLSIQNIVIDVEPQNIMKVLYQAKEVRLLTDYSHFVITYLDSSKLPILQMTQNSTVNITGFSLRENDINGIYWLNSAVLYDAVFLLHKALEVLNARNIDNEEYISIDPVPLSCKSIRMYQAGPNITSTMRELSKMGKITGIMNIDEYGRRQDFKIKILNFQQSRTMQMGFWDSDGMHLIPTEKELERYLYTSIKDKTFRISTKLGAPYVMEVIDNSARGVLIDQKRYEGFCIDLIEEIASILDFKYQFELVPDGQYGSYNEETKTWDGLIKRLLDREADLAICDLTVTYQRKTVVDFSLPFMNLGISILFNKPEEKVPNYFSFLLPLSADVWICMATAYLIMSIMLFLLARIAPGEWINPHPCNTNPEALENNFNLKNSMWLMIGSIMQQGSDILPRVSSIRMLTSMWWFFILIMITSYTANLAAFLTIDKMDTPIKNVEDLAKQAKIKYGVVKSGSTSTFFRDSNYSTYKRMWNMMTDWRPSVFTSSNDEGVDRVTKGKRQYAFLMESTTIEYKMERNCELDKVGGLIDNKGYGIAMPRNFPYRTMINNAILTLGEKGVLQRLKKKWWQEMGGGLCNKDEADKVNTNELGLPNVGGVFLLLMYGCGISFFIAICEFLWNTRKVAVREKITPWEALVAELKFAINIFAITKPVKIAKYSSSSATSMENRFGRAVSATQSVPGSFLHLDTFDKFDKDHNTNLEARN